MGYDMTIRNRVQDGEFDGYFRLNIWGMGSMRRILDEAGVVDWDSPMPDWPEPDADQDPDHQEFQDKCDVVRRHEVGGGKVGGYKFCSNDGWIVTPRECEILVGRLVMVEDDLIRRALQAEEIRNRNWRPDEEPQEVTEDDVQSWRKTVNDFTAYCAEASQADGFEVW